MSFGDFEYQEHTSNTLARILKSMRQEQVILDAVQNPIDDIEEYPDARQVESIKGIKDHIGAVTIPASGKNWHFANEPNETTRLWLWFREGWRLRDYSRHGNDAFADQMEPAPYPVENYVPLRRKLNDDLTTSGRLYGIIDGKTQYYRVNDGPENRITDLLTTNTEVCFSIFFSPFQTYILDPFDDCSTVFQKLDDDQSTNALRVCVMEDGMVRYSLNYLGTSYEVETAPGVVPFMETPEFVPGQFLDEEFLTQSTKPWQWNPDVEAPDWTWLFFTFNKTTRQLKIFKVADGGFAATELVTSSDETGKRTTTFAAHYPMNEGTGATQFTDVINGNHATFNPVTTTNITWLNPSPGINIPRFQNNTSNAKIPTDPSINNLSAFTVACKIRLLQYPVGVPRDLIMGKNLNQTLPLLAGDGVMWTIQGNTAGSHELFVEMQNNTAYQWITATNPFPLLNTWYDVIFTYNGGTTMTLHAGAVNPTPVTIAAGVINTTPGEWEIGHPVHSAWMDIVDVIIDKGTVWGSTQRTWYASLVPGDRSLNFPAWKPPKPPEPETPLPVVRPVEKVYEKLLTDGTAETVKLNAPSSTTPFVSVYNVPGGTPATTPEVLQYDVADGTTGGGGTVPISTIYTLAAASSTGNIDSDETAYVQRIADTSSVLYNKKPTDLQFWINDSGGDCDGMAYPAIIRTNGTYTKIGAGMNVSSLTSTWTSISGVSYVDRTALAVGDGVGIVREGHTSGTLGVRRGGTDVHSDNAGGTLHSWQHLLVGTTFTTNNDHYSIAGTVKVGGETLPGSNPYVKLTNVQYALGHYQLNSTLENIAPTKVIWRVRRVGSAASATLKCYVTNGSGTVLATIGSAVNFNTIGTTVQDLQFQDVNNIVQWQDGYMIVLGFDVKTGLNTTTNYLEVNYNSSSTVGGSTIKARMFNGTSAYVDVTPACDWAGKIYTGGASFTAYVEFEPTLRTITEKVNTSTAPASKLFGLKHSKITVTMKKVGNPTGPINARIFDNDGSEKALFNTVIDASSLSTSDAVYVFTHPLNNYVTALNDRIGLQFAPANTTDKVLVKINTDSAAGAPADGTKSILSTFRTGVGWQDSPTLDLAAEIFTGGVPDITSKPKAAIRCDSIFSLISQKKITRAVIPVRKFGSPTGTYYIRSVRGSDNSNRDLLGSGDISTLSTTTYLYKDVSNYSATHFLGESDKIVVEFEGGDPSNGLQVQVDKLSTYDDEDTRFEAFDGVNWNKEEFSTWDMAATLYTGGDTYIPDAGTPYVEPPDYYDHDLLIGGGAFVQDQFVSFYGMRIRDFKLETSIPNLEQMDTMYSNKYSRRGGAGEVGLMGYATLNSETTAPP